MARGGRCTTRIVAIGEPPDCAERRPCARIRLLLFMRVASGVAACMVLLACPCGAVAQPAPDTTPPSFVDFEVLPQGGDITNGAVDIAVRVRLTDDGSGVAGLGYPSSPSQAVFLSPSGAQTARNVQSHQNLASGASLDGRYEFTMPLQFSESGLDAAISAAGRSARQYAVLACRSRRRRLLAQFV